MDEMKSSATDKRMANSVVRRVSVRLSEKDWSDLVHFMVGDLHNMETGCPIKAQMERICDCNRKAIVTLNPTDQRPACRERNT